MFSAWSRLSDSSSPGAASRRWWPPTRVRRCRPNRRKWDGRASCRPVRACTRPARLVTALSATLQEEVLGAQAKYTWLTMQWLSSRSRSCRRLPLTQSVPSLLIRYTLVTMRFEMSLSWWSYALATGRASLDRGRHRVAGQRADQSRVVAARPGRRCWSMGTCPRRSAR